jgi:rod shape-determining protein MreC
MEYSPPPLFKQGAPARVKVTVFAFISIALLVIDARFHALSTVRQVTATVLYPFQMAALMPRDALASMGDYFSSLSALEKEVRDLKSQQVAAAQALQQAQLQMAENANLRRLMDAREHLPVKSMMSEILYDARDPSTRKIVLDRGAQGGVLRGLPVIDSAGVVGQVTRVFPFTSEVTLLTDKEQAIPVQVLRSGLRTVAYGRGHSNLLDLRFVAPNADIQVGDVLVTSGLDGVYPAGLAVAKVIQVESVGQGAFGRVVCQPLAGIDRNRQLLIVMSNAPRAPRPPEEPAKAASTSKKNLPKMEPIAAPPLPASPLPPQGPVAGQAPPAQAGAATPQNGAAAQAPAGTRAATTPPAATQPPAAQSTNARPPATQAGAAAPTKAPAKAPAKAAPPGTQPGAAQPGTTPPAATPPAVTPPATTPPAATQTPAANQGARASGAGTVAQAAAPRPIVQAQAGAKKEGL